MKTHHAEAKNRKNGKPLEVVEVGSVSVPIYRHTNIVSPTGRHREDHLGAVAREGKPQALAKYQSDIFTIAYYEDHPGLHQFETSTRRRGA